MSRENSYYKHKYRELLKAVEDIKAEIDFITSENGVKSIHKDDVSKIIDKHCGKETWNGIHGQVTAPTGTFEKIFNDNDTEDDGI